MKINYEEDTIIEKGLLLPVLYFEREFDTRKETKIQNIHITESSIQLAVEIT